MNFRNSILLLLSLGLLLATEACKRSPVDPPEPTPTDPVVYDPDIRTIIYNNCLTCHSGPAPSAGLSLDSYSSARASTESGDLIARINDANSPMPPAGLIRSEDREKISQWMLDGFPER